MLRFISFFYVSSAALSCLTEAKYGPGISYIDDVQLSYNNGSTFLHLQGFGRLTCLNNGFGCKISIRNNPSIKNELIRMSKCYLKGGIITQQVSELVMGQG